MKKTVNSGWIVMVGLSLCFLKLCEPEWPSKRVTSQLYFLN